MRRVFTLNREKTALLVVDVQERLFGVMEPEIRDRMARNIKVLAAMARRLGLPLLVSEQYPKGLGHTLPELLDTFGRVEPIVKVEFSCCGNEGFMERLGTLGVEAVVITGIETHVCVLMTGLELLQRGYTVHLPADATCSRAKSNWETGVGMLRDAGAIITSTETVLFQLLGRADTDDFRALQPLVR